MDYEKAKEILYKLAGGADYSLDIQEKIHQLVTDDMCEGARFNVGDVVYIFEEGAIVKARIDSRVRYTPEGPVRYYLSEGTGRRIGWTIEALAFATPEELVDRVTSYFGAYLKSNGN